MIALSRVIPSVGPQFLFDAGVEWRATRFGQRSGRHACDGPQPGNSDSHMNSWKRQAGCVGGLQRIHCPAPKIVRNEATASARAHRRPLPRRLQPRHDRQREMGICAISLVAFDHEVRRLALNPPFSPRSWSARRSPADRVGAVRSASRGTRAFGATWCIGQASRRTLSAGQRRPSGRAQAPARIVRSARAPRDVAGLNRSPRYAFRPASRPWAH